MNQPRPLVLLPEWWAMPFPTAQSRLCHAYLLSIADRNGVCRLNSAEIASVCGAPPKECVSILMKLMQVGYAGLWESGPFWFAWVPHVADFIPVRGKLSRSIDPMLPPPPKQLVIEILEILWSRSVSVAEAKRACPPAFGVSRIPKSSTPPIVDDVSKVWECWRSLQKRPSACRLSPASKSMIKSALKEASADHIVVLFKYAYTADEPGPRYWRGHNDLKRTYLGLDNLLRANKLAGRIQSALEWSENHVEQEQSGDGTTLGPMAAFKSRRRRVPAGTKSRSPERTSALSLQCRTILKLFVERGDDGVRTSELAEIARKYTGRISELRDMGAQVVVFERCADGNNLYKMLNYKEFNGVELDC